MSVAVPTVPGRTSPAGDSRRSGPALAAGFTKPRGSRARFSSDRHSDATVRHPRRWRPESAGGAGPGVRPLGELVPLRQGGTRGARSWPRHPLPIRADRGAPRPDRRPRGIRPAPAGLAPLRADRVSLRTRHDADPVRGPGPDHRDERVPAGRDRDAAPRPGRGPGGAGATRRTGLAGRSSVVHRDRGHGRPAWPRRRLDRGPARLPLDGHVGGVDPPEPEAGAALPGGSRQRLDPPRGDGVAGAPGVGPGRTAPDRPERGRLDVAPRARRGVHGGRFPPLELGGRPGPGRPSRSVPEPRTGRRRCPRGRDPGRYVGRGHGRRRGFDPGRGRARLPAGRTAPGTAPYGTTTP